MIPEPLADECKCGGYSECLRVMRTRTTLKRRRRCLSCGARWNTFETRESAPAYVRAPDARDRSIYDAQAKARQGARTDLKNIPANLPEGQKDARDAAGKAVGVSGKTSSVWMRTHKRVQPSTSRSSLTTRKQ